MSETSFRQQGDHQMPKQEPVERFRISCETDVTSLGPVMSALAKIPNLAITGNELITDIAKFAQTVQAFFHEDDLGRVGGNG